MVVIGVTGGVGTGKSTVAGMFKQLGAVVLDADMMAREVVQPKQLAWRRIVKEFGPGILQDDQSIDRQALAKLVFKDPQRRQALEAIVHPHVMRMIRAELRKLKRARRVKAVVLDVPLLVEVGAQRLMDALVVVTAPPQVQRERLKAQHGWSDDAIRARMAAQWDLSAKVAVADHVVDNANGVDATRQQVKRIWNQLTRRSNP